MNRGSLRLRLSSAAAVSLVFALAASGLGLVYLFELHVERRIETELAALLNQLIAATYFNGDQLEVRQALSDPRFSVPLSGYYWQVESSAPQGLVRSRSLWDEVLALPDSLASDGLLHLHEMSGPNGALLIAVERTITDPDGRSFRAMVTEDHRVLTTSVSQYTVQLVPSLALLGAILLGANFLQITVGLAPLARIRAAVGSVLTGNATRLEGEVPDEVRPLSDEINRLLDEQDAALSRARARAADLAHGLKTPLQVLAADVRTLRGKGEIQLADDIDRSVSAIYAHVERELARARVAYGVVGAKAAHVGEALAEVVDVVKRTPFGRDLNFDIRVAPHLVAAVDEGDFSEVAGNLIENAARFALSRVRIEAGDIEDDFVLTVTDDGPGIPASQREDAVRRGTRLDGGQGSGLGLAIVSDIVKAYRGTLKLTDAGPGLRVTVRIPKPSSS